MTVNNHKHANKWVGRYLRGAGEISTTAVSTMTADKTQSNSCIVYSNQWKQNTSHIACIICTSAPDIETTEPIHTNEEVWTEPIHTSEEVWTKPLHTSEEVWTEPCIVMYGSHEPIHTSEEVWTEPIHTSEEVWTEPLHTSEEVWTEPTHRSEEVWTEPIHTSEEVSSLDTWPTTCHCALQVVCDQTCGRSADHSQDPTHRPTQHHQSHRGT